MNNSIELVPAKYEKEVIISPAYTAYYEHTSEKNGVEVIVEVKKHNRLAFFEAIESQLMYMPNIKFLHKLEDNMTHDFVEIAAKVVYRDNDIIISESSVYNKPHILLGVGNVLINYGYISFPELEIEPKDGAVGLIMDANELEVTPNREALIWSNKTRKAVLKKYDTVTETATKYVNEVMKSETDYIKWIQKASSIATSIRGSNVENDVLSTLASIIDISKINNITFSRDKTIIYKNDLESMFGKGFFIRSIRYERWEKKVKRDLVKDLSLLNTKSLYYTKIGANKYKDRFIFEEEGRFILLTEKENAEIFNRYKLITESTAFKNYDDLEVPEDRLQIYLSSDEGVDDDGEDQTIPRVDLEAARKLNKQIVVHHAYISGYDWIFSTKDTYISDLFSISAGSKILFGTGTERSTLKNILKLIPKWFTKSASNSYFKNIVNGKFIVQPGMGILKESLQPISCILLAKENLKYLKKTPRFLTIYDFFVSKYSNGVIVLTDLVKLLVTAKIVNSLITSISRNTIKKYSSSTFLSAITNSNNLVNVFEDPNEKQAFEFLRCVVDKLPNKYDSYEELNYVFNLGQYQAMTSGIIIGSEDTIEATLTELNDKVPDSFCDEVDNVITVDTYYPDLIEASLNVCKKLLSVWGMITLYESKYFYKDEYQESTLNFIKGLIEQTSEDDENV